MGSASFFWQGDSTARLELGWCGVNHGRGSRECPGCTQSPSGCARGAVHHVLAQVAVHRELAGLCTVSTRREHGVRAQALWRAPRT